LSEDRPKRLPDLSAGLIGKSDPERRLSGIQFDVNLERNAVYECGAMLLAILAYPKPAEPEPNRME